MAIEPISFAPNQESSYDDLGGSSPLAVNVIIDPNGVVYKRPGITTYADAPSTVINSNGIEGIYATNDSQLFVVAGADHNRKIYKVNSSGALDLSTGSLANLNGTLRPTFTETEAWLVIAGGNNIQKVDLQTLVSSRLDGDPPFASHVTANSSRLLANDTTVDKTKVRFSGIAQGLTVTTGHETWSVTGNADDGGFFTAEARPDNIVALQENTNEVFVWGTDNLQVFVPDASNIFAPAATREFGCLAPASIIKADQEFFWLDQHRRFVYSDGRQFQNIEKAIKSQLDEIEDPTDCIGYRVLLGHVECFVWMFPSDGRTFCYQKGGGWSQWLGWDINQSNFKRLIINAHHLRRDGGINVVGTTTGKIGKLSLDATDDLGEPIVSQVYSGFIDRKTDNRKLCRGIKVSCRRGSNTSEPIGRIEWRDDTGNWNGPITFDFGSTGDNYIVKEFRGLGIYNRRQWRFTFSDSAQLALVRVVEEFDVLGI